MSTDAARCAGSRQASNATAASTIGADAITARNAANRGVRIRGGVPRTYYVAIESAMPSVPGETAPPWP